MLFICWLQSCQAVGEIGGPPEKSWQQEGNIRGNHRYDGFHIVCQ